MGQLGNTVSTFVFKEDGTFFASVHFIDAKMPDWKISGTYNTSEDKLITSENGEKIAHFSFVADELIINDGQEEFRYQRITE